MAAPRHRRHVLVARAPRVDAFQPHPRDIEAPPPPPRSPKGHARRLRIAVERAVGAAQLERTRLGFVVEGARPGTYLQFDSKAGTSLKLESLQQARRGIEVVAFRAQGRDETRVEHATVFVPPAKDDHFTKRFETYESTRPSTGPGRPRHAEMVDRISAAHLAALRSLWTDPLPAFPGEEEIAWWEVWLRRRDNRALERWMEFAELQEIHVGKSRLEFDDRIVTIARASARQIAPAMVVADDLAELRRATEASCFFLKMRRPEQAEWSTDLSERCMLPGPTSPFVCILDTGVNAGHPLLEELLAPEDCHAHNPTWRVDDHLGHGTEMAGLSAYGDLTEPLASSSPVRVWNRLESVKILPRTGGNAPELWAAITAAATSRVEIQAPDRRRVFMTAVTGRATPEEDGIALGQPTSWSAAVDALAAGRSFDSTSSGLVYIDDRGDAPARLFVISAGNIRPPEVEHLDRSDTQPVEDPAHAWNALTVGACTEKAAIMDPSLNGWRPVAPPGELSPWSRTSVAFLGEWPIKPDVVYEGGNVMADAAGNVDACSDLSLLTTHFRPFEKLLVDTSGTSPASAQVARLAAAVMSEYPDYWPETVRALVVHAARWNEPMKAHLGRRSTKGARLALLRRYGHGVPTLERALRSADDALTLVAQRTIRPFEGGKYREMHVHALPWPKAVLQSMGEVQVRLRVTLSYFVEPNPARRSWKGRYRYPSHGLRFEIKGPTEKQTAFSKRLSKKALDEDEQKPSKGESRDDWFIGEARWHGSVHSDVLKTTAAELAERGVIAVYPVAGWWKDSPKRDRSELGVRYSLVVSIETDATKVDLWTPVANEIGAPIETTVPV